MIRRWLLPVLRGLRIGLFLALDMLISVWPARRGDAALVIRLDAIGDFVIWLQNGAADIANELRRTHPRVILLANAAWAPMARDLQVWDEVIAIDPGRYVKYPGYRARTLAMIRALGISTAIQPRAARLFLLEDTIVRACGAGVRVGSAALPANISTRLRAVGDRGYTQLVRVPLSPTVHESARGMAFARAFCRTTGTVVPVSRLRADLPSPQTIPDVPYIVVALGAGWSGRQWPLEKFATLLSSLHESDDKLCVLVGSGADRELAARLKTSTSARLLDLCGQLSLAQSVHLIRRSRLLIANESGPMHIGVWCAVPVIGLVGGGHFGWFAPYPEDYPLRAPLKIVHQPMPCFHCNWHCKFDVPAGRAVPCVRDIDTELVVLQARRLLNAAAEPHPA